MSNLRISIGGPPEKPFICSMQEKLPNFSANCSRNLANQANKQRESNQPEYHSYSQSKTKKRKTLQLINQKNQVFKYNPEVQDSPTRSIVSILVASFASFNSLYILSPPPGRLDTPIAAKSPWLGRVEDVVVQNQISGQETWNFFSVIMEGMVGRYMTI